MQDGTVVLAGGDSYESWDIEKRILKQSVTIPNSSLRQEFISVKTPDGHIEFVDFSGKPIPKYSKIKIEENEFLFSINQEEIILRLSLIHISEPTRPY